MLGPASHQPDQPRTPESVPFSEWYHHGWQLEATCRCERTRVLHMGMILKLVGEQSSFSEASAGRIAAVCWCIDCRARTRPALRVVTG